MRRGLGDLLISSAALMLLLLILASIDNRVRDQASALVRGTPSAHVSGVGRQVQSLSIVVAGAVREQSVAHAPLVIFTLAAAVLVLFMVRT